MSVNNRIFDEALNHLQALWDGGMNKKPYPRAKLLVDAVLFNDIVLTENVRRINHTTALWDTDFGRIHIKASTEVQGCEWALIYPGDLEDWYAKKPLVEVLRSAPEIRTNDPKVAKFFEANRDYERRAMVTPDFGFPEPEDYIEDDPTKAR